MEITKRMYLPESVETFWLIVICCQFIVAVLRKLQNNIFLYSSLFRGCFIKIQDRWIL